MRLPDAGRAAGYPPTGMFLDEAAAICPLPLPTMLQDSGGKGIQILSVAHGLAQLEGRWHDTAGAPSWTPQTSWCCPG